MGLFNTIFGNTSKTTNEATSLVNWIPLTSLSQLEEIKARSTKEPVAIFKHSTRCGISRMVIGQFEKNFTEDVKDFPVYYLDLLSYRDISNEIGYTFQVLHQSPQLLIIKDEVAVAHASHYDITQLSLTSFRK